MQAPAYRRGLERRNRHAQLVEGGGDPGGDGDVPGDGLGRKPRVRPDVLPGSGGLPHDVLRAVGHPTGGATEAGPTGVLRTERAALQEELTALAGGDRTAFDPLFRRLWPLLRGFARRCLPSQEADDAAQDALLRVFRRASEFDTSRDALSWILGIAAWQVRTHRTKSRRRREDLSDAPPEREDPAASPEEQAAVRQLAALLDRALGDLSPADAATLTAYAQGERPDLPGATFRKRVERALARLKRATRWRIHHDPL